MRRPARGLFYFLWILSGSHTTNHVSHLRSEVSLSGRFENCKLVDVSVPLNVISFFGNIEVVLKENHKGAVSIQTISVFIDLIFALFSFLYCRFS